MNAKKSVKRSMAEINMIAYLTKRKDEVMNQRRIELNRTKIIQLDTLIAEYTHLLKKIRTNQFR